MLLGNVYDPVDGGNWCWADGHVVSFKEGQQQEFAQVGVDGANLWVEYPRLLCVEKNLLQIFDITTGEMLRKVELDLPGPASWPMNGVLMKDGSCYLNYFQKGVWYLPTANPAL